MKKRSTLSLLLSCALWLTLALAPARTQAQSSASSQKYFHDLDETSALWSSYKYRYISEGRVVSLDEDLITTSEGQGYALLRAVWSGDAPTFRKVWKWTRDHLQTRGDHLFSWKWKGRVLDRNNATDADSDIALALILAGRRFEEPAYFEEARSVLGDLWNKTVLLVGETPYLTGGDWAPSQAYPTLHTAYLAPYAYAEFAAIDSAHPWKKLIDSSYRVLHWIFLEQKLKLPPEKIFIQPKTGALLLRNPTTGEESRFSYDAFPIYWRVALDWRWNRRNEGELRQAMLRFFQSEWKERGKFLDRYTLSGSSLSGSEGLPLYATVHALASIDDEDLAQSVRHAKIDPLLQKAGHGRDTPYYLQNWLWFDRALELQLVRDYDEFLGFLRPFDFNGFSESFPWLPFYAMVALFFLARYHALFRAGFLATAFYLCVRYLGWRLFNSLNFREVSGPPISIALWLAEAYCFSTVALLLVQVGFRPRRDGHSSPKPQSPEGFCPSVDIFIPIYSESVDILEKTLIAAQAIRHPAKTVHVLDDSHRAEVRELAESLGARYHLGPRKHAKAGNLNQALKHSSGELVVVFDTDHIPVASFLEETLPYFADPTIGFVQTPHHFYNEDIFQRAFRTGNGIPDEQDMFNHAIQGGRAHWNGSFFVGSGAVFRRRAIEALGGWKLMSITEDIHTSQHLHASGWRSAFVDKDLAVGLTAENLSSYIVQRRRWMLGCLQIFFKDNPLFLRGLSFRQRIGYFASLYYFFFPAARVAFWLTPLYFLLFHWHPIFSEVSVLTAYLLPYMIALPLISATLMPRWPRLIWGTIYEAPVSFPLFRSMFDLFLPKSLGFKVTPKGIVSARRAFDAVSSRATLIAGGITVVAIAKGLWEFYQLGIEKDAYFFNLSWAVYNLFFLGVALLLAWERPQRRENDRIQLPLPFELSFGAGTPSERRIA